MSASVIVGWRREWSIVFASWESVTVIFVGVDMLTKLLSIPTFEEKIPDGLEVWCLVLVVGMPVMFVGTSSGEYASLVYMYLVLSESSNGSAASSLGVENCS